MPMKRDKDGKWQQTFEWELSQFEDFIQAAQAQACFEDALALAAGRAAPPEGDALQAVEDQCRLLYGRGLVKLHKDSQARGRALFLMTATELAAKNAAALSFVGKSIYGTEPPEPEESQVIIDV